MTDPNSPFQLTRRAFIQRTALSAAVLAGIGSLGGMLPARVGAQTVGELYSGFDVDFYCAPADLGTGDGSSEANAMALIDALALTHAPGTVIGVLPGNYSTASPGTGNDPAWQIASNGTSTAPIRAVAKYSAVHMADPTTDANASRLRHPGTNPLADLPDSGCNMVGGFEKEYQEWWGFLADENHGVARQNGALAHWHSSVGCAFHRMRIIAIDTDPGFGTDNHSGISVRDSENILLADNRISGFNFADAHNHNGIVRYDTFGLTVRNNEIFDCRTGIYLKDSPPPNYPGGRNEAIYFNLIHDCGDGIEVACAQSASPYYTSVYQNIVLDCDGGIMVKNDTVRVRVYNNTVVLRAGDGERGCIMLDFAGTTTECRDNIFVQLGGDTLNNQRYRNWAAPVSCDYNRYYTTNGAWYRYDDNRWDDFADWQTNTSTDADSSVGNPLFVDLVNNDFHLSSSSPCLTMSSTAGPVGAYITGSEIIGVTPAAAGIVTYQGFAVDLYCAPADLGTGDGSSEANAMALIDALALTHSAGTVIGALPGNYSTASTSSAFDPAWQISSNGTSSAPIRVVAKYSAVHMTDPTTDTTASRLRHTGTTLGTAGVMVGGLAKEYQQWWGFLADENYGVAPEGAAVAHWYSSTGCAFRRMRIIAVGTNPGYSSDNHSGIGLRESENILIQDNRISGFNHGSQQNNSGIVRYDSTSLTIRNNEVFDCGIGIFLKDNPPSSPGGQDEAVYFNLVHDCTIGIEVACANNASPDYTSVYQNIVLECDGGIAVSNDTERVRVYNNTVVLSAGDGDNGCVIMNWAGTTIQCRDNIFVQRGGDTLNNQRYRTAAPVPCNYNRYYSTGTAWYRYDGNNRDNLADWQTLISGEANSSAGNPLFVDLTGNDFHLGSSSPCLTMSSVAGPVGAYIAGTETIGVAAI
jgi:hypothetical protein